MRLPEEVYLRLGFSHDQFEQAMLLVQQLGSNQAADRAMGLPEGTVARWAKLWIKAQNPEGNGSLDDDGEFGTNSARGISQDVPEGVLHGALRDEPLAGEARWGATEPSNRPRARSDVERRDFDDTEDALRAFRLGVGARSGLSRLVSTATAESIPSSSEEALWPPAREFVQPAKRESMRSRAGESASSPLRGSSPSVASESMDTARRRPAHSPLPDSTTLEQRSLALSRLDEVAQGLRKLSEVSERAVAQPKSASDEEIRATLKLASSMMEFMAKQQEQFFERIQGLEDAQRQVLERADPGLSLGSRVDELTRAVNALSTMDQVVRVREEVAELRDLLEEVLRLAPRLKDHAREVVRLELGEQAQGLGDRLAAILRQHADAMLESDARMPGALADVLDAQWTSVFARLIESVDSGFRTQSTVVSTIRTESDRRDQDARLLLQEMKQTLDRREQSLRNGLEQQAQAQVQLAQMIHQEDQNRMGQLVDSLSGLGRQISQNEQRLGIALQHQAHDHQRVAKELLGTLQQHENEIRSTQAEMAEVREILEGVRRILHDFTGATAQSAQNQRLQQDLARLQSDLDALQIRSQPRILL
jgi:hypothetical protein